MGEAGTKAAVLTLPISEGHLFDATGTLKHKGQEDP